MKIFALSDQHGLLDTVVPPCDLLIVAGDNCPDGFGGIWARHDPRLQLQWFDKVWMAWRRKQPAKHCLVTWGNHDYCGQRLTPFEHIFHIGMDDNGENAHTRIVVDSLVEYEGLKIWLTPWCHEFMDWAFMKSENGLAEAYRPIPEGLDILVSHDTPYGYGDVVYDIKDGPVHVGSKALRDTLDRVKPKVVICGHIHDGHGKYFHGRLDDGDHGGTVIYNVAVVTGSTRTEVYTLVHDATEIEL